MTILHVVGAAITHEGRCLVTQRGPAMSLAGKWEFPGGKVEPGETGPAALIREVAEELGLQIAVGPRLGRGRSQVADKMIQLDVYAATRLAGALVLREHSRACWASADELAAYDWAEADIPSVAPVVAWLRARG